MKKSNSKKLENIVYDGQVDSKKLYKDNKSARLATVSLAIFLVVVGISIYFINAGVKAAAETATVAYEKVKENQEEESYRKWYDSGYEKGESDYHVSNRVDINIESVKAEFKLEVLKIRAVDYQIENKDDNKYGITLWSKFTGVGVYTVNLQNSEFITDSERGYVLVRIPHPEFDNFGIISENTIFKKDDGLNNAREGDEISKDQKSRAVANLKKRLTESQEYNDRAKKQAVELVKAMVRKYNPSVENLTVDVEFID